MPPPQSDYTNRHVWEFQAARDLGWIVAVVLFVWFIRAFALVLVPVFIAMIAAYLSRPMVRFASERWRIPRMVTAATLLLLGLAIVTVAAIFIIPLAMEQLSRLIERAPKYLDYLSNRYGLKIDLGDMDFNAMSKRLRGNPGQLMKSTASALGGVFGWVGYVLGGVGYALTATIITGAAYLFWTTRLHYFEAVPQYIPASGRGDFKDIIAKFGQIVGTYFKGQLVVACFTTVCLLIGFAVVGVPYWFLVGLMGGIMSIVPYLQITALLMAMLLMYIDSQTVGDGGTSGFWIVGGPLIVYLISQALESWVVTPWVQSSELKLSPLVILLTAMIGGVVGGVLGVMLAIPLTACAQVAAQEYILPRWRDAAQRS